MINKKKVVFLELYTRRFQKPEKRVWQKKVCLKFKNPGFSKCDRLRFKNPGFLKSEKNFTPKIQKTWIFEMRSFEIQKSGFFEIGKKFYS